LEKERSSWDKSASDYEQMKMPLELHSQMIEKLMEQIFWQRLFKYAKGFAIELGCGTGKNSLLLTNLNVRPLLFDFSSETVRKSKEMFEAANKEAAFVVGDMRYLPFKDACFDFAHSDSTLEHLPEPKKATQEIQRVILEGAHVFVTVPNKLRLDGVELWKKIARPNYTQNTYSPKGLKSLFNETHMHVEDLIGFDILSPLWSLLIRRIQRVMKIPNPRYQKLLTASIVREEGGKDFFEQIVLDWLSKKGTLQRTLQKFINSKHNTLLSINLAITLRK
jgi:ubiquinone/menaquinone biosynthesis C-methylase UbiE